MKKLLLSFLSVIALASFSSRAADDVTTLADIDFTVLTEGSPEAPVAISYRDLSTKVPGVSSSSLNISKTYEAGGSLLIQDNGSLELAYLSGLSSSSMVRIVARVRIADTMGAVTFATGSYSTSKSSTVLLTGNEWQTVTTYLEGVSSTTRLIVKPYLTAQGLFIENIKIEYSPSFVIPPVAYLPNDADGTKFTASCSRIANATDYLLDVYTYDADGQPDYFMQDEAFKAVSVYSDPSKLVTGLDPDKTYYYTVRARNAEGNTSDPSNEIEVVKCLKSLDAPQALDATDVTVNGFTANWSPVAEAYAYNVNYYKVETLEEDGEITVFEEDFSGVTSGSIALPDYSSDPLDNFTGKKGWLTSAYSNIYANGFYALWPYASEGYVITPAIDLSVNDGKFTVTVTAGTRVNGVIAASENTMYVELVQGNDKNSMTVIETAEAVVLDKDDLYGYTFEFTKGAPDTRLRITYDDTNGDYAMFIDDIVVSSVAPAGTPVEYHLGNITVEGETSVNIAIDIVKDQLYRYDVTAIGSTVLGSGADAEIGDITSEVSNRVDVKLESAGDEGGIDFIDADANQTVWKEADGVIGFNGSDITVTDITGRTIYAGTHHGVSNSVSVNVSGALIVVVDGKVFKIIM